MRHDCRHFFFFFFFKSAPVWFDKQLWCHQMMGCVSVSVGKMTNSLKVFGQQSQKLESDLDAFHVGRRLLGL